jgi:hypothetical protein
VALIDTSPLVALADCRDPRAPRRRLAGRKRPAGATDDYLGRRDWTGTWRWGSYSRRPRHPAQLAPQKLSIDQTKALCFVGDNVHTQKLNDAILAYVGL